MDRVELISELKQMISIISLRISEEKTEEITDEDIELVEELISEINE